MQNGTKAERQRERTSATFSFSALKLPSHSLKLYLARTALVHMLWLQHRWEIVIWMRKGITLVTLLSLPQRERELNRLVCSWISWIDKRQREFVIQSLVDWLATWWIDWLVDWLTGFVLTCSCLPDIPRVWIPSQPTCPEEHSFIFAVYSVIKTWGDKLSVSIIPAALNNIIINNMMPIDNRGIWETFYQLALQDTCSCRTYTWWKVIQYM